MKLLAQTEKKETWAQTRRDKFLLHQQSRPPVHCDRRAISFLEWWQLKVATLPHRNHRRHRGELFRVEIFHS